MGVLTYDRHHLQQKFQALWWSYIEDYLYNSIKMHIFSEKKNIFICLYWKKWAFETLALQRAVLKI